jgi:hypothetical protein
MNKTRGRGEIIASRANAASWFCSCSAPSQLPSQASSLGGNSCMTMGSPILTMHVTMTHESELDAHDSKIFVAFV